MIRDKSLETGYLAKYKVIMETDFQFYNCIMIENNYDKLKVQCELLIFIELRLCI